MKSKTSIILIILIILALAVWGLIVLRSRDAANQSEVIAEPLTPEELVEAAERLKAPAPSAEDITGAEAAGEALAGTSTFDTMSSKEQDELIKAAEALKAQN